MSQQQPAPASPFHQARQDRHPLRRMPWPISTAVPRTPNLPIASRPTRKDQTTDASAREGPLRLRLVPQGAGLRAEHGLPVGNIVRRIRPAPSRRRDPAVREDLECNAGRRTTRPGERGAPVDGPVSRGDRYGRVLRGRTIPGVSRAGIARTGCCRIRPHAGSVV